MKKILLISILLLFPIVVNAEECTDQMLNSYSSQVNQIKFEPKQLGSSSTYEVWVSNIPNTLAVEKGRTITESSGFLGYASAGQSYIARVYVADGSACSGTTVKEVSVNIPSPSVQKQEEPVNNNNSNNNSNSNSNNTSPDVEEPIDTSVNNTTPPVINQTTTIEKPSVDNSQDNTTDTRVEEEKVNDTSEDINEPIENVVADESANQENSLLDTTSPNEKVELEEKEQNDTNEDIVIKQIWIYSLIGIILLSVSIIGIIKYRKKRKAS